MRLHLRMLPHTEHAIPWLDQYDDDRATQGQSWSPLRSALWRIASLAPSSAEVLRRQEMGGICTDAQGKPEADPGFIGAASDGRQTETGQPPTPEYVVAFAVFGPRTQHLRFDWLIGHIHGQLGLHHPRHRLTTGSGSK